MGRYGRDKPLSCSFCGKDSREVVKMIQGPDNTNICDECVDLCSSILRSKTYDDTIRVEEAALDPDFLRGGKLPFPGEIKGFLDEYVVGQDFAKKVISVSVYNHYKRLMSKTKETAGVEIEKSNILLLGPTGCGKTLLARTLARFLDIPFAIGDATTLTEAGYVGEDVENLLLKLLTNADMDIRRAQTGIIFIDEIDKIGRTTENRSITRDVSGEGVQQSLLKMLEGTVANVPPRGGRKHPEQSYIPIDTTNILFICGGSFTGVEDIIRQRIGKKKIGFKGRSGETADIAESTCDDNVLTEVIPEDLIKYGLIPEMVGRLPIITVLDALSLGDMVAIMTRPKNAVIRQYQALFEIEGKKLEFTSGALAEIAERALEKETGARSIRSIVERLMLDTMYSLPEDDSPQAYKVTAAAVRGDRPITKSRAGTRRKKKSVAGESAAANGGREKEIA